MNPLCIYHENCADGFGAAWVFKNYADREHDFYAGTYQNDPPDCAGRDVYLVDFSYKRPVIEDILKVATRVVLIDHHKTAIEDLQPLIDDRRIESLVNLEKSGATLAWEWFCGKMQDDEMPQLLRYIEDRDLWRFALPFTREVNADIFSYPFTFEAFDELIKQPIESVIREGSALERKHLREVEAIVKSSKRKMTIDGYTVPFGNVAPMFQSDVGNALAKTATFSLLYQDTNDGRVYSLRSVGDFDVSAIAKKYGGGGHKNAAGFRLSFDAAKELESLNKE